MYAVIGVHRRADIADFFKRQRRGGEFGHHHGRAFADRIAGFRKRAGLHAGIFIVFRNQIFKGRARIVLIDDLLRLGGQLCIQRIDISIDGGDIRIDFLHGARFGGRFGRFRRFGGRIGRFSLFGVFQRGLFILQRGNLILHFFQLRRLIIIKQHQRVLHIAIAFGRIGDGLAVGQCIVERGRIRKGRLIIGDHAFVGGLHIVIIDGDVLRRIIVYGGSDLIGNHLIQNGIDAHAVLFEVRTRGRAHFIGDFLRALIHVLRVHFHIAVVGFFRVRAVFRHGFFAQIDQTQLLRLHAHHLSGQLLVQHLLLRVIGKTHIRKPRAEIALVLRIGLLIERHYIIHPYDAVLAKGRRQLRGIEGFILFNLCFQFRDLCVRCVQLRLKITFRRCACARQRQNQRQNGAHQLFHHDIVPPYLCADAAHHEIIIAPSRFGYNAGAAKFKKRS